MQIDLFPDFAPPPPAKPPPKPKPESASDVADRVAAEMLAKCDTIRLNSKALALELKLWEISKFLATHYSADEAIGFAVRLIETIEQNKFDN